MTQNLSHFQCLFFSLGLGVISDFNKLRIDTQAKNIAAWMPVISIILQGFVRLDEKAVSRLRICLRTETDRLCFSLGDIYLRYTHCFPNFLQKIFHQRFVLVCEITLFV